MKRLGLLAGMMHTVADRVEAAISVPLLHIADATARVGRGRPRPVLIIVR
jgi:aspartate/glutamate racemase